MVAIVTGVVVLVAAGVAAVLLNKTPTGEEAVRAYFDKLAAGDADGALTHVLPPEIGSLRNHPLLSATAISDPASRPAGLQVVERIQTREDGALLERVTVTYRVGDAEFRQTLFARQPETGQPFLLEEPFVTLDVLGHSEREFSINGVPIPKAQSESILAFPGVYTATVEADALFAESTVAAIGDHSELPAVLNVDFEPGLAPGAEEAVQAAVNAHLDTCLQDHTPQPVTRNPDGQTTGCPFTLGSVEVQTVTWSYGRYPDITLEAPSGASDFIFVTTQVDGLVRYDLPDDWVDDEFEFSFDGVAFIERGSVVVETNYQE